MKIQILQILILFVAAISFQTTQAADLKVNNPAPPFELQTHEGQNFSLSSRKGNWTVLYFYPKAGTPGCTRQAETFNANISKIRAQGADVFGVSTDSVEDQKEFHQTKKLDFTLLADPAGKVVDMYGTKMPVLNRSKRWTYIIDPDLKIREIDQDVDPVADSQKMADKIAQLKLKK